MSTTSTGSKTVTCLICGRPASAGYVNEAAGERCVDPCHTPYLPVAQRAYLQNMGRLPKSLTIGDMPVGFEFRLDFNGYAGRSYRVVVQGERVAGSDGRHWSLEDCGLKAEQVIGGPIWGVSGAVAPAIDIDIDERMSVAESALSRLVEDWQKLHGPAELAELEAALDAIASMRAMLDSDDDGEV